MKKAPLFSIGSTKITDRFGSHHYVTVIISREVKNGFERVEIAISKDAVHKILSHSLIAPGTLKRMIVEIYPDHNCRPVPTDIVGIKVEMKKLWRGKAIVTLIILRGHYIPGASRLTFNKLRIENIERKDS